MTARGSSAPPTVSAIIVFWNAAPFIAEAIESVLAQTYRHWELLLVDDGSTDGSSSIAEHYAADNPTRIRYLEHPGHQNLGISASRNLGLRSATGTYLAYLDADDVWVPQTLGEQVATLEAWPQAAMVYGPIEWWFSWTDKLEDRHRDYVEELGVPSDTLIQPPKVVALFLRNKAAVPSGMLVRREVAERLGGFEDLFKGEYDDQVFVAKICLCEPVFASSRCWYRYRRHENSTVATGERTGATHGARLVFLNWLSEYFAEQRVKSPEVWRALRIETWRFTRPRAFHLLRRGERMVKTLSSRLRGAS